MRLKNWDLKLFIYNKFKNIINSYTEWQTVQIQISWLLQLSGLSQPSKGVGRLTDRLDLNSVKLQIKKKKKWDTYCCYIQQNVFVVGHTVFTVSVSPSVCPLCFRFLLHILLNNFRDLFIFAINVDFDNMLLLDKNKGLGSNFPL